MKTIVSPGWTKLVQFGTYGSAYLMGDILKDEEFYYPIVHAAFLRGGEVATFELKEHKVESLEEAKKILQEMKDIRLIDV